MQQQLRDSSKRAKQLSRIRIVRAQDSRRVLPQRKMYWRGGIHNQSGVGVKGSSDLAALDLEKHPSLMLGYVFRAGLFNQHENRLMAE